MGEIPESREVDPTWEEPIREGVQNLLAMPEDAFPLVTALANFGMEEVSIHDLPESQRNAFRRILFETVGFDPDNPKFVGSYDSRAEGSNPTKVRVFFPRIADPEDKLYADDARYLHELRYMDGRVDYFLAPKDFEI